MQSTITYRANVNSGQPGNVTTQSYTPYGVLASSQVNDGRARTVTYLSNAQGQVIRRQEADGNAATGDPSELWFRFDGRELGRVGNNGTLETDYATSVSDRGAVPGTGGGAFRNGAAIGAPVADWGAGYEPYTSYRQGSEGGTYTVREGDTLQGTAERVYSDASLSRRAAAMRAMRPKLSLAGVPRARLLPGSFAKPMPLRGALVRRDQGTVARGPTRSC